MLLKLAMLTIITFNKLFKEKSYRKTSLFNLRENNVNNYVDCGSINCIQLDTKWHYSASPSGNTVAAKSLKVTNSCIIFSNVHPYREVRCWHTNRNETRLGSKARCRTPQGSMLRMRSMRSNCIRDPTPII